MSPIHAMEFLMSIRSVIGAAVVAVGMGSAAGAATFTTIDYDLYLRYEGTAFQNLIAYDRWNNWDAYSTPYYPIEDPLGLNVPNQKFPGLAIGDIARFIATIVFPDDPKWIDLYDNGGRAPVCSIGKTSCTDISEAYFKGPYAGFSVSYSDRVVITGSTQVGSVFQYSHLYPENWTSDDGRWLYYAWTTSALFTVVQIVDTPAPVPLPATAALLPLGIGALALMRRRRRQVN